MYEKYKKKIRFHSQFTNDEAEKFISFEAFFFLLVDISAQLFPLLLPTIVNAAAIHQSQLGCSFCEYERKKKSSQM
jgi:hypothetical protein